MAKLLGSITDQKVYGIFLHLQAMINVSLEMHMVTTTAPKCSNEQEPS